MLNECLDEHTPHVVEGVWIADVDVVLLLLLVVDRLWKFWIMPDCCCLERRRAERAADAMMAWLPVLLLPAAIGVLIYHLAVTMVLIERCNPVSSASVQRRKKKEQQDEQVILELKMSGR